MGTFPMHQGEQQRYELYSAWCELLGLTPASFDSWRVSHRKIYDRPPIAWYAANSYAAQ